MQTLDDLFTRLDNVILNEMPTLYKVETIGDAYVVAANLMTPDPEHAATMVRFALRAQEEAAKVPRPDGSCLPTSGDGCLQEGLQMRVGIHSGPIMSGIVGKIRRRFCMFGDTVNMGARTESSCPPGGIQLTAAAYALAAPVLLPVPPLPYGRQHPEEEEADRTSSFDSSDEVFASLYGEDMEGSTHRGTRLLPQMPVCSASSSPSGISLTDRGWVEVKGSPEPLRMYLATAAAVSTSPPMRTHTYAGPSQLQREVVEAGHDEWSSPPRSRSCPAPRDTPRDRDTSRDRDTPVSSEAQA